MAAGSGLREDGGAGRSHGWRAEIMAGEDQQQLRNLRDFLMVYNKMTEMCFTRCAKNLNYRSLTMDEDKCLDSCATKFIRSNHRLMAAYVGLMPAVVQRRMDDMEKQSKELEAMAESKPDLSLGANPESAVPVEAAGVTDHVTSTSESP
ncbi:mitochondrial import inner membrane translocase subunit Tim10 B [Rana temporaria]|uniref:mitochondrial import inner membrane translocase subunit Tim10 B n=1 Tax=Rana temporaria TaxID=8407 RepID=UPI001AACD0F3|nr:mitochondrial import inner membrane translocase subunit Tim10 B [Rana temporaria]